MNPEILCLLAALVVQAEVDDPVRIETSSPVFLAALRGEEPLALQVTRAQNPQNYDSDPALNSNAIAQPQAPTYSAPIDSMQGGGFLNPFSPNQANPGDPFMQPPPGAVMGNPYAGGGQFAFGVNGPQPYQLNRWLSRYDAGYLFSAHTSGVAGSFAVTEVNAALRYSTALPSGLIFSWTPEINSRSWTGPAGVGLPGQVWRAASDFELAAYSDSPWSAQVGFTPAVASDFQGSLTNKAYNFDGRGILFYRVSPQLSLGLGVVYWNRVKNYILPYAGVIWTPDDQWELRLMYPKSRISYFVGTPWGAPTWLYGSAEFNVESYQVDIQPGDTKDRMQMSDYRFALGIRSEGRIFTAFAEGGYLVDRKVQFRGSTTAFGIQDGPMVRAGLRF